MINILLKAFWARTVVNGRSFIYHERKKKSDRIIFLINIFYLLVFYNSVSRFGMYFINPNWVDVLNSSHMFIPFWPVAWIKYFDWETCVRAIYLFYLIMSFMGIFLWKNSRVVRIMIAISLLLFLALISSFGKISHTSHLMLWSTIIFIFLPTHRQTETSKENRFLEIFFASQLLIFAVYFLSGLFKFYGLFTQLINGQKSAFLPDSLAQHIAKKYFLSNGETFLGEWIMNSPAYFFSFCLLAGYFIEFLSIYVAFRPSLHRLWGLMYIFFHGAIILTIGPNFTIHLLVIGLFVFYSPFNIGHKPTHFSWTKMKENIKRMFTNNNIVGDRKVIVFFNGEDKMYQKFISYISKYKLQKRFLFDSVSSPKFDQVKAKYPALNRIDSIIVVENPDEENEIIRTKSNGAIFVLGLMKSSWYNFLKIAHLISPMSVDIIYDLIRKDRKSN